MKKRLILISMLVIAAVLCMGCKNESTKPDTPFMETVLVKAGNFYAGADKTTQPVTPGTLVTLTKNFYMGKYEVTQKQWYDVMGNNPSKNKSATSWENLPVEQVNWYDAVEFCNALSTREGRTPYYIIDKVNKDTHNTNDLDPIKWTVTANTAAGAENGYRLPTEAEWEYAARGGQNTASHAYTYAGSNDIEEVAWHKDNSGDNGAYKNPQTHPVRTKTANALGLYDMTGNVSEWCWDWDDSTYPSSTSDPTGSESGKQRVLLGGSYSSTAYNCHVANRSNGRSDIVNNTLGFRVVRFQ